MRMSASTFIVVCLLSATIATGCSRRAGESNSASSDHSTDKSSRRGGKSIESGTLVYESMGLQIAYDEFRPQPDGTAMVFVEYRNTSTDDCFEIEAEIDREGTLQTLLLGDDGRRFIAVQASGLQGRNGLRLYPGGSSNVAFTFVPSKGSTDASNGSPSGRYHMASSQNVSTWSASEGGPYINSPSFSLSLAIRDMKPD